MTATIAGTLTLGHSGIFFRPLVGLVIGLVVTASLFWVMQYLIETADHSLVKKSTQTLLEFVRIERDETIKERPRKPEVPPKPETQPPQPPSPTMDNPDINAVQVAIAPVPVDSAVEVDDGYVLNSEGDYLPIVKVAPIYPNRALSRGIQGYCVVEYTVTRTGMTKDAAVVSEQCSSSLFNAPSIKAALKFKYKPRIIGGEAVEVSGVQNKFTYEIVE